MVTGLAIFGLDSVRAAFAPDAPDLIAAGLLLALGGSMIAPCVLGLIPREAEQTEGKCSVGQALMLIPGLICAFLSNGNLIIAWTDGGPDGSGSGVDAQIIPPKAETIAPIFQAIEAGAHNQRRPAIQLEAMDAFQIGIVGEASHRFMPCSQDSTDLGAPRPLFQRELLR